MHLWRILHLIVQHCVVGLLGVAHQLVYVLVDLNCAGHPAILVLKLNVVLAGLFRRCFHLNRVPRLFDHSCSLTGQLLLVSQFAILRPPLSRVNIDVKVLASLGVIIPLLVVCGRGLVLGAYLFFELINALLVTICLLLIVCLLAFACLAVGTFWLLCRRCSLALRCLGSTSSLSVIYCDRCWLLRSEDTCSVNVVAESELLWLESDLLLHG